MYVHIRSYIQKHVELKLISQQFDYCLHAYRTYFLPLMTLYAVLIITGVPAMVPNVTVNDNRIGINFTLILVWGEPFNNLDPIVNYTVSCSGDDTCPPNFTTTDNTTRSYISLT